MQPEVITGDYEICVATGEIESRCMTFRGVTIGWTDDFVILSRDGAVQFIAPWNQVHYARAAL